MNRPLAWTTPIFRMPGSSVKERRSRRAYYSMKRRKISPRVCSMKFDGHLLSRGFWLYVWRINSEKGEFIYVGRTGDSSSCNASSPFTRVGQHLDSRENAKGNSLTRHLVNEQLDPTLCSFELIAIGQLFPEQTSWGAHCEFRDRTAALEKYLADQLIDRGLHVIGTHHTRHDPHGEDLELINRFLDEHFL